ncbi:MAG TPA: hypothetical protein VN436_01795 [Holophaga sp.]|nr:hypothetical protein [Holophaga sp.]
MSVDQWALIAPYAEAITTMLPQDFAHFQQAADITAAMAEELYRGYLLGKPLPGSGAQIKHPSRTAKTAYRRQVGMMVWALGNSSDAAKGIENGQPQLDMKECLPTAPRARRTKATAKEPGGHLYLIIPFRHATSDAKVNDSGYTATGMRAMPTKVYSMVKALEHSTTLGTEGKRLSATGYLVPAWRYEWKGRLSKKMMKAAGIAGLDKQEGWKVSPYQGMVRMGKAGHTTYLTFRIMSQTSPASSWVRKEQKPFPALATAIKTAMDASAESLAAAFVADLQALVATS